MSNNKKQLKMETLEKQLRKDASLTGQEIRELIFLINDKRSFLREIEEKNNWDCSEQLDNLSLISDKILSGFNMENSILDSELISRIENRRNGQEK